MECNVALTDASVLNRIASIFSSSCAFSLGSRGCDSARSISLREERPASVPCGTHCVEQRQLER